MAAHSEDFPWPSYYGHYRFFESALGDHSKVRSVQELGDGIYEIRLLDGRRLKVFVCECYSFGLAEYIETIDNLEKLDAIIINSQWCGFTQDAWLQGWKDKVFVGRVGGLMGALNRRDPWNYMDEAERKWLKKNGYL